jgi:hypothetical protein
MPAGYRTAVGEQLPPQSLLDHAELWFDHEVHGKQVFCTFRKALVYIKKGVFPDFILSTLK